ncbi:hypothetical protein AJ80_05251 [Polytolypa hystricis UAMH7299]|uniref:Uncharacterized protein n=1 Tax=Polytolypa hystricis (strain UAMH7299) TaxID=1447883 RepID=A0A2B7Y5Q2_POLH7|nr:hypothetical protein AJ80_05251 [Polytolypa hystricis UAMH7299]
METDDPIATATMNGTLTPVPPQSDSAAHLTPGKRKRSSSPVEVAHPSNNSASTVSNTTQKEWLGQTLRDLLQILSKYDSDLGVLKCPLPSRPSVEPDNKRTKLSESPDDARTIESRIASGQYTSLQAVVEDVEAATNLVTGREQKSEIVANGSRNSLPPNTDLVNRARVFRKHLDNFILRNPFRDSPRSNPISSEKVEEKGAQNRIVANSREDKVVLTLFGNAPRGRQLFSSLQTSTIGPCLETSASATVTETRGPIDEATLPNGITTAKMIPFNVLQLEDDKQKTRTFGEVFAPRANLPILEPPRKVRPSSKVSSAITWASPYDAATGPKPAGERRGYTYSSIRSGHWLAYGYASNRALNGQQKQLAGVHGQNSPGTQPEKPVHLRSEDDSSLFRRVYSSFAPAFDSSGLAMPENVKDQIWWNRSGAKRLHTLFPVESEPDDDQPTNDRSELYPLDEDSLAETVNSFVIDTADECVEDKKKAEIVDKEEDKELDEVLGHISDLLETLNSYRQIRLLSQPVAGSQTPGPAANDSTKTPERSLDPSSAEVSMYEALKSSLSAIIATLPPYAVAKLDGTQLSDLNISQKILVENTDFPGTMEEDEYSLQQAQLARASQAANTARTPTPSLTPARTAPYHAVQPPTAAQFQRAYSSNTRPKHAPPPQNFAQRPPAPMQYPSNNSPQAFHPSRQIPQRAGYGQPQFPQAASPPYTQSGILQQFQRPSPNGIGPHPSQRIASPARGSPQPYANRPSQPVYQQQPQPQNGPHNMPVPGAGAGSPPRHPSSYGPSPQRPAYVNSTPGGAQPRYFPQQTQPLNIPTFPANQASPTPPPYSNSAAAAAIAAYGRTAAEQTALMERNKAQLAVSQRQKSGTPQPAPPPLNGQAPVQMNIPPVVQSNGNLPPAAGTTQ